MPRLSRSTQQRFAWSRDPLTNTLTRPIFLRLLHERVQRSEHDGEAFVICLVDVDQLQNVNDRLGHRAGDGVLAALAERLLAELGAAGRRDAEHVLARYDGDALMLLASPCTLSEGERLAETLRAGVARAPLCDGVAVTVSIGIAQFRIGESTDDLLARTERALHVAKQFGRDRVEASSTPPSRAERAPAVPLLR
jgi:diguanylate cyclase (GGDEF)-like protein